MDSHHDAVAKLQAIVQPASEDASQNLFNTCEPSYTIITDGYFINVKSEFIVKETSYI